MRSIFILSFLCLSGLYGVAQSNGFTARLKTLPLERFNTLKVPSLSLSEYRASTNYAVSLLKDTTDKNNSMKGQVILMVVAEALSKDVVSKKIDYYADSVAPIINIYEKNSYHIPRPRVSDVVKLAKDACDGDYKYIYSRFKERSYFWPVLITLGLFIIFSVLNMLGYAKWKYRVVYNKAFFIIIGIILILFIGFKLSCSTNINESSVYGIRF